MYMFLKLLNDTYPLWFEGGFSKKKVMGFRSYFFLLTGIPFILVNYHQLKPIMYSINFSFLRICYCSADC